MTLLLWLQHDLVTPLKHIWNLRMRRIFAKNISKPQEHIKKIGGHVREYLENEKLWVKHHFETL